MWDSQVDTHKYVSKMNFSSREGVYLINLYTRDKSFSCIFCLLGMPT